MAHLEGNGSVAHLQRGAMALSGKACVLPVSVPVRVWEPRNEQWYGNHGCWEDGRGRKGK